MFLVKNSLSFDREIKKIGKKHPNVIREKNRSGWGEETWRTTK